jgi:hypothetical protein
MRPREGQLKEIRKNSLNDAVWLTLKVVASHRDEFKEYQDACGQVDGFEKHFAPEYGPADTYNELVERRARARSKLQAVISEYFSDE